MMKNSLCYRDFLVRYFLSICLFSVLFWGVSCSTEESQEGWDNRSQRQTIESFIVAENRGDTQGAYERISSRDQAIIAKPLTGKGRSSKAQELAPEELLHVVRILHPYDIRGMTYAKTFQEKPKENETTEVVVSRYNGKDVRFNLVWEVSSWRIDLGLSRALSAPSVPVALPESE